MQKGERGWSTGGRKLLLLRRLLLISLLEPLEEGGRSLADLLGGGQVRVLLASPGSPLGDDFLADEVVVVVQLEGLDDLRVHVGVLLGQLADETLGSTKKGLLVALSSDDLGTAMLE